MAAKNKRLMSWEMMSRRTYLRLIFRTTFPTRKSPLKMSQRYVLRLISRLIPACEEVMAR